MVKKSNKDVPWEVERKQLPKEKQVDSTSNRWWVNDEYNIQVAQSVFNLTDSITKSQTKYWKANLTFAQLYENIDSLISTNSFPFFSNFGMFAGNQSFNSKLTFNIVKACVDSVVAKIAKNKPRAKFITSGGDHNLRKKALNLTKYVDGIFYESDAYKVAVKAFKDCTIFGTGCLKVYYDEHFKKFKIERVIVPIEIIIDTFEAQYGEPMQIHQRKLIDKDVLMATFKDKKVEISQAETFANPNGYSNDRVMVIESWKKPSFPGAKDGRHTICVNNAVLFDEAYKKDYFPFVFINWSDRVHGFYGYGLAEELLYIQTTINTTHKMIKAGQAINSVPRVFAYANSLMNKSALYDAGVIEMRPGATPPTFNTSPAASADLYAYQENLYNKGFQISGVSQLQASSQKPAGLNSGAALREYADQGTERFAIQSGLYEDMFLEIAHIIVDTSRDVYKENKDLSAKSPTSNKKLIEKIKFSDSDIDDEDFSMQCFPVSKLPTSPEGRLQFVTELAQAGYIQKSQVIELMEMPDVENFFSLTNATFDVVCKDLDNIVEKEEFNDPDPRLDLALSAGIAQAYYLKMLNAGVSEEALQMLRDYGDAIISLQTPPAQPQVNQPVVPSQDPNQPIANPLAPPTSDILPVG